MHRDEAGGRGRGRGEGQVPARDEEPGRGSERGEGCPCPALAVVGMREGGTVKGFAALYMLSVADSVSHNKFDKPA